MVDDNIIDLKKYPVVDFPVEQINCTEGDDNYSDSLSETIDGNITDLQKQDKYNNDDNEDMYTNQKNETTGNGTTDTPFIDDNIEDNDDMYQNNKYDKIETTI